MVTMERRTEARAGIGLEVMEQVCSRLCHDLAGPIGAIRNGLELIEEVEEGEPGGAQALDLIGHSAELAARRLRLFRLAYGRATSDGVRNFNDIREAALDWLTGGRVTLQWPMGPLDSTLAPRPGLAKTLLNMVVVAAEAIPYGGIVAVSMKGAPDSGGASVTATGRGVKWPPEVAQALTAPLPGADLEPRTITVVIAGKIADHYGFVLGWETPDAESLLLRLSW